MKSTMLMTNARMGKANRTLRRARPGSVVPNGRRLQLRTGPALIRWPSDQQISQVSKRLSRITRQGIRREISGDYFNSGDFAYRIQEIIRSTDELFKKSQRI